MVHGLVGALALSLLWSVSCAAEPAERPKTYDDLIARLAETHGVPEAFVHRVVKRESRYHPGLVSRNCFGLMQIKPATARGMGYGGAPSGLLDPRVNLTYGVPYLANAYRLADGDADRAVSLYAGGYYYLAKRKKMLSELRTAASEPLVPAASPAPQPEPPANPLATLLSFLGEPLPSPEPGQ